MEHSISVDVEAPRTRLLLIRHAATDVEGRLCGSLDLPLSAAGRAQIDDLRRRGPTRPPPDALYSSSLRRAREVADALGAAWGLAPRVAAAVGEIHCGEVEGMRLDDLRHTMADLWDRNAAQSDDAFSWPGGESYAAFRRRVLAALSEIAGAHPGARVGVITHAGVVSQVLGTIAGRAPAVWDVDRPHTLAATEVEWVNGAPAHLLMYNEADWF